jgi:hypothetical protein
MDFDWMKAVSTVGGLSGFASLYMTTRWRRQDQQRTNNANIVVVGVIATDYGFSFWIDYRGTDEPEGISALVEAMGLPAGRPLIGVFRIGLYDPASGTSPTLEQIADSPKAVSRLSKWVNTQTTGYAQHFVLIRSPPPPSAKLRITVSGAASGKVLAKRTLHISA